MTEFLDAFDDNLNPLGSMSFEEIHKSRLWHLVTHNWIVRPQEKMLVQLRNSDLESNGGLICVSAGGHLVTGETIKDSPRETKEEIGLTVLFNSMTYIGSIHLKAPREIAHVLFMKDDTPLDQYQLQEDEVMGVYEIGINEGIAFFAEKTKNITLTGYKRSEDGLVPDTIIAGPENFTSGTTKPWLWLFSKAKRYINGRYDDLSDPEVDIKNPLEVF